MLGRLRYYQSALRRSGAELISRPRCRLAGNTAAALTFDDGPDPRFTPLILDVLAEHGVRATFFMVGHRAESYPDVVRAVVDGGHAVGSHTLNHPDMWTLRWAETLRQYGEGHRAVESVVGRRLSLVRPPKGWLDLRGATAARYLRLRVSLWSKSGDDWKPGVSAPDILHAIGRVEGGDIILLHDSIELPTERAALDRSATVAALAPLIEQVRSRGLTFVTL